MAPQESPEQQLADVVDRFTRSGYRDTFRAEGGSIRAVGGGCLHPPEELQIEAIERFEGVSDPADEAIVLALRCVPHDRRGTYVAPYGKHMPVADSDMIRRIPDARPR